MTSSPSLRIRLAALSAALLLPSWAQANVSYVAGIDAPLDIAENGRTNRHYVVSPEGPGLVVEAEGPVDLSLRVRALLSEEAAGVLRVRRNDETFSDNAYALLPDRAAHSENGAVSEARVFHLRVPVGRHVLAFEVVQGPALSLRVLRTSHYDPALSPAPELPIPRPAVSPAKAPEPEVPAAPVMRPEEIVEIEVAHRPAPPPKAFAEPTGGLFVERDIAARTSGLALSLRGGAVGHLPGGAGGFRVSLAEFLEVAWDIGAFSVFVEGGYWRMGAISGRPGAPDLPPAQGQLHVAPGSLGFTSRARLTQGLHLSVRLGGTAAFVAGEGAPGRPIARSPLALGGTGGVGLEWEAGPGRLSLEARWLVLRTDHGVLRDDAERAPLAPRAPVDLGGGLVLAGYRLEF